jgi:hypothetical protein
MPRACSKGLSVSPPVLDRLSQDRLENTFREMAEFSHKVPVLPDEAFTRGSLYRDHD